MTPPRKRPTCHSCGNLMAGHKRPNGTPVCPPRRDPTEAALPGYSPANSPSASPSPAPLRREESFVFPKYYRNPNFVDPLPEFTSANIDRVGTPDTWVSTEPADDIPVKMETMETIWEGVPQEPVDDGLFPESSPGPSSSSASSSSSSRSSLRRTLTTVLRNSRAVASLFSAPRDDVDSITQEARRNGLFTGLIHRPRTAPVKEEGPSPAAASQRSGLERTSSWWVVLGHNPEAVGHLLDLQARDTTPRDSQNVSSPDPPTSSVVPEATRGVNVVVLRNSFLDLFIVGVFSAFCIFYLLSMW